ncbi:energy transducer TonB [bacterium]|nr:energy transducer TonB [bacterium]
MIPKAKNPKTPPYPESLEDEGIEGSVTLELLISKEGKVLKAKVIKSDHELFSESALQTVKNYRFSPGKLKDGSVVDSLIEFVIKFEISL